MARKRPHTILVCPSRDLRGPNSFHFWTQHLPCEQQVRGVGKGAQFIFKPPRCP